MNSQKEGGSMLAGMTTPAIVPIYPIRQLSGSIIPEKDDPDWRDPDSLYPFFSALSFLFGKRRKSVSS
jgi:hypothetical protein